MAFDDAGEPSISCTKAFELALAVVGTATQDPVDRLYAQFPPCLASPCTEDELSTAQVTLWTTDRAYLVELDSRLRAVPAPAVVTDPVWPSSDASPEPAVERPTVKGAPREVARREPYPFCGRTELDDPTAVLGCFRDAVLTGREAEMINEAYSTEGAGILWLYRYAGSGRLISYERIGGDWSRSEGALGLGISPLTWDFKPWTGTSLPS